MRYKIVTVANVICIGIKDRLHQWSKQITYQSLKTQLCIYVSKYLIFYNCK